MNIFETYIDETPCKIQVTHWEPYRPAFISGPPEDCTPAEGGYGDWEVLDMRERPAPQLAARMTEQERKRIDSMVFDFMEKEWEEW